MFVVVPDNSESWKPAWVCLPAKHREVTAVLLGMSYCFLTFMLALVARNKSLLSLLAITIILFEENVVTGNPESNTKVRI
jgi:hypothetical protein